jgi:hypothetical protein
MCSPTGPKCSRRKSARPSRAKPIIPPKRRPSSRAIARTGDNRLPCGDGISAASVARVIGDVSATLPITLAP